MTFTFIYYERIDNSIMDWSLIFSENNHRPVIFRVTPRVLRTFAQK